MNLTINAAAEALGISDDTLRKLVGRGDVACLRIPGTRIMRIPAAEIERVQALWTGTTTPSNRTASEYGASTGAKTATADPFQRGRGIARKRKPTAPD